MAINTDLLLKMMLGGGAAMTQGQSPWPTVAQAGSDQITSENFAGMLQQILGGGGKMTIGDGKFSLTGHQSLLGPQPSGVSAAGGVGAKGGQYQGPGPHAGVSTPANVEQPQGQGQGQVQGLGMLQQLWEDVPKPSVGPLGNLSPSDLVGLTPEMMSSALRIGQNQQQLNQKKLTDVVDSLYKKALIQGIEDRGEVSKINAQTALAQQMRKSPLELPGLGQLDFETWKSLDTKTKAYSYYAFNAKQNNDEVMPYSEWSRQTDKPTLFEYYELAKDDPEFKTFLDQYNESKATQINIGQQVDKAEALAGVKSKTYFSSPEGLVKDVDDYIENEAVQNELFQYVSEPEKLKQETTRKKENYIDRQIKSAGGKILDKQLDGTDFVWVVEWPDGSTSEVRYGN